VESSPGRLSVTEAGARYHRDRHSDRTQRERPGIHFGAFTMDRKLRREGIVLRRRQVIAAAGASLLAGSVALARAAPRTSSLACVVRPQQIEGPYFVDEKLNRSDIRPDPRTKVMSEGVPLSLTFKVSRTEGSGCLPLAGAQVDVWHCDAEGLYSDTDDFQDDTRGFKFLRGYQITDRNGAASFTTIFPGWYPGRTVHIHFKIRVGPQGKGAGGKAFTSQIYFDDALTDVIHTQLPYSKRGQRKVRNNRDVVSLIGGSKLILPLREQKKGYAGIFEVSLEM
jgi:protocatechuate 3,4-dioxygenase beta subunit